MIEKEDIFHFLLHTAIGIFGIYTTVIAALAIELHDTLNHRFEWKDFVFRLAPAPLVYLVFKYVTDAVGLWDYELLWYILFNL